MRDVWAIIDATFDPIARPTDDQRVNYSGYLKGHANKYQGVETPDGHLTLCGGPIEGRRADGALLRFTKLPEAAAEWAHGYGGRQLFIYGDPAYGETEKNSTYLFRLPPPPTPRHRPGPRLLESLSLPAALFVLLIRLDILHSPSHSHSLAFSVPL